MPDDNDYTPFTDLNTFHEVGNWVDSRTFFTASNHHCGGDQISGIPPLTDVLDLGCRVYAIPQPEIREAMLSAAAAQFGMDKSQLKHLISLYTNA